MENIRIELLGQVGVKFQFPDLSVFIDPYLSNSVQDQEDDSLKRLVPIPINPEQITNANFVLITHEHRDHCDEQTLVPIAKSSPECVFMGPPLVCVRLRSFGIKPERIKCITDKRVDLTGDVYVDVVPSAHPEVASIPGGGWKAVGYILGYRESRIYHAGDTSLTDDVIDGVSHLGNVDVALLPVNECNYMREKQGILGNMTVREAFHFADQISAKILIPTHWDMFEQNQVYKEEIELLYKKIRPKFQLMFGSISI